VENCTLLTLPLGWLVCEQAKANVCHVWWLKIAFIKLCGGKKNKKLKLRLVDLAVSLLVM